MSSELTRIVERVVEQALAGTGELARPTLGYIYKRNPPPQQSRTPA